MSILTPAPIRARALLLSCALCLALAPIVATHSASERANRIAQQNLIIDTHIDVPYRLHRDPADVSQATDGGEFDYPRARSGGLNAPFMSIYIPASVDEAGDAFSFAEQAIDLVTGITTAHPDKFAIATCAADVVAQQRQGLISLPMGMENGGPIEGKLANAAHFFERGIRYITLAHSKSNHISDSSYDDNEAWLGLSPFGQQLVGEMNRLGIMIDVSHITDQAFWQVLALSQTPVIASHSSLRHFTPGFHRNMTDAMVRAMAAKGGVIQINYGSAFLTKAARDWSDQRTAAALAFAEANGLESGDPQLTDFLDTYREDHPYPFATLDDVLDHIDRAVELAGIDAVGLGSDYDGVGDSLPTDLKDVASYPNLIDGLLKRGYSESDINKILGGNTLRVWREVEAFARQAGTPTRCQTAATHLHPEDSITAPSEMDDEFHFVVLGDAQFHHPSHFNRVVDQVRALHPAFVIQVGDLIEGYNSNLDEIRAEWQRFKAQIQPLAPIPYYAVPGNHDVYSGDKKPDAALEALFAEAIGPLHFSFRYKNALFVGLNSDSAEALGEISDTQISWLADRLRASDAEHKFVFMHKPPLLMAKTERLHELFTAHGVDQVIYGHHHHYHHIDRDGVKYTMTNASGAMAHSNQEIGGFFHLLQVSVRGSEVDVAVINADAVQGQDIVAPADNYDMFAVKRGLLPKSVKLEPLDASTYRLELPLNNTSQRDLTAYLSCRSDDNRWLFEPARLEAIELRKGKSRTIRLTASFDDNRRPESDPQCTVSVPMLTARGSWITVESETTASR